MRSPLVALGWLVPVLVAGCGRLPTTAGGGRRSEESVAMGVSYVDIAAGDPLSPASDAHVLDVDLSQAAIDIASEARDVAKGRLYGESYTVMDWCRRTDALGGVNGGFFGTTDGS